MLVILLYNELAPVRIQKYLKQVIFFIDQGLAEMRKVAINLYQYGTHAHYINPLNPASFLWT